MKYLIILMILFMGCLSNPLPVEVDDSSDFIFEFPDMDTGIQPDQDNNSTVEFIDLIAPWDDEQGFETPSIDIDVNVPELVECEWWEFWCE